MVYEMQTHRNEQCLTGEENRDPAGVGGSYSVRILLGVEPQLLSMPFHQISSWGKQGTSGFRSDPYDRID